MFIDRLLTRNRNIVRSLIAWQLFLMVILSFQKLKVEF